MAEDALVNAIRASQKWRPEVAPIEISTELEHLVPACTSLDESLAKVDASSHEVCVLSSIPMHLLADSSVHAHVR